MKIIYSIFLLFFIQHSFSQSVGIGTTTPSASSLLHVDVGTNETKGLLITGNFSATATVPDLGTGSRLMFYPGKGAFRAGIGVSPNWNNVNVGFYSVAMGSGTLASGLASVALGQSTKAIGDYAVALGYLSAAPGNYATAIGYNNSASGLYSFASGFNNSATGTSSLSLGNGTTAGGHFSTAIGVGTAAYGSISFSAGNNTVAKGYSSTVVGMNNDSLLLTNEQGSYSASTPLFIIGNGNDHNSRTNAVVVQKSGNVAIGNIVPAASAQLHVDMGTSTKGVLITGAYNPASTIPDLGSGSRMMFYPGKSAFRVGGVSGTQWNNSNVGTMSVAMGENTIASASNSFASGVNTAALGAASSAIGEATIASGQTSLAVGRLTVASGDYSAALGYFNKAKGFASTVIGLFNDSVLLTNQASVTSSTPLFIIGNGNDITTRSNAMLVEKSGNVAIGNIVPDNSAQLHVDMGVSNNKGMLVSGFKNAGGLVPDLGAGSRMMFYPGKSAFRAGTVDGIQWNNANVGHYSMALGVNNVAAGFYSVALGYQTLANANYTTAIGINSSAIGFQSTAIGSTTIARGTESIAMGTHSVAGGDQSSTLGYNNRAKGYASTVVGLYNDSILLADQLGHNATTPLFIVGNGTDHNNRSNALVVRRDGNTGIGTSTPAARVHVKTVSTVPNPQLLLDENSTGFSRLGFKNTLSANAWNIAGQPNTTTATSVLNFYYEGLGDVLSLKGNGNATLTGTLTQNSDARLKKNIEPITSSLQNLTQLTGYFYKWKDETRDLGTQSGVLAQEVQQVFPELVKEDDKGILSVNYNGLIPVMINAIKEQQEQIKSQNNLIKNLEERLNALEKNK